MHCLCCSRKQPFRKEIKENIRTSDSKMKGQIWDCILPSKYSTSCHVNALQYPPWSQPPLQKSIVPLMGSVLSAYTVPCTTSGSLKPWSKVYWFHLNVPNQGWNKHIQTFLFCFTLTFMHARPTSQPKNHKLLPVTLIFCPPNKCYQSSLSPQKKFWFFHFFYKQNEHIIYVCEQSVFMVFLFVDRMIGIKLHSVDKKKWWNVACAC